MNFFTKLKICTSIEPALQNPETLVAIVLRTRINIKFIKKNEYQKTHLFTSDFIILQLHCTKKTINDENWTKIVTEAETINNITYYFPSEVKIPRRNLVIVECQKAIEENLKLIGETEFNNKMDIEFVKSRK